MVDQDDPHHIFPECFNAGNKHGNDYCIHWTLPYHEYNRPMVMVCDKNHTDGVIRRTTNVNARGLRFDDIPDELFKTLIDNRPAQKETEIFTNRPIVNSNIFDLDTAEEWFDGHYSSDCAGLYIRNVDTLQTLRTLHNRFNNEDNERHGIGNERQMLIDLAPDEEIVGVGNGSCNDMYIRKHGGMFVFVFVDKTCVMEKLEEVRQP